MRCYLNCIDAEDFLIRNGIEPFQRKRVMAKARTILARQREQLRERKLLAKEAAEQDEIQEFTHENFRVNIDTSQHRNYGMVNVSIHCLVEVWQEDDVEKEYLVNFSDYKTKEWLTRLLVWALMNQREVLIKPAGEAEMTSMRVFVPKEKVA